MYLHGIKGFLHWGFNFYNSQYSISHIDPFFNTHASYAFPSGDAFLVYPGPDEKPMSSIRAQVQREALDDLNALTTLESVIGRERVVALIMEIIFCSFVSVWQNSLYRKDKKTKFRVYLMKKKGI